MIYREWETKYALLDAIPDSLYSAVVTHTHGDLLPRTASMLHWRACLLQGRLPEESALDWPAAHIRRAILMRLEALDIAKYCKDQEALADSILQDVLEGIRGAEEYFAFKPDGFNDKLAQRQKISECNSSFVDEDGLADHVRAHCEPMPKQQAEERQMVSDHGFSPEARDAAKVSAAHRQTFGRQDSDSKVMAAGDGGGKNQLTRQVSESTVASLNLAASGEDERADLNPPAPNFEAIAAILPAEGAEVFAAAHLESKWQALAATWHELSAVYGEIAGLLGRGWDFSQGVLAVQGWRDIVRYRKLLARLPDLQDLLAMLGRLRDIAGEDGAKKLFEEVFTPIKRHVPSTLQTWNEHGAMETGGIQLSSEISRLLPSELAMLGHRQLKWLWYAKRAESKLLTYCHCGLLPDPLLEQREEQSVIAPQENFTVQGHGPVIVCLDTSGSMHGPPETIAKAAVLEALRIGYHENRPCHVYAFGGPGQMLEHELDLARGGLLQLLQFLRHSFQSGTDVVPPLLSALEKQQSERWRDADILLVTDGRFPLQADLFDKIESLRIRQGLRLHGLVLGNWKSQALAKLCDPLHCYQC